MQSAEEAEGIDSKTTIRFGERSVEFRNAAELKAAVDKVCRQSSPNPLTDAEQTELCDLHEAAHAKTKEFAEAVRHVAMSKGLDTGALRAYIVAVSTGRVDELRERQRQIEMFLE